MNKEIKFKVPEQYETLKYEYIEDIGSSGYILLHKKSGARVAVIPNDDTNKLFCITFFTPPENSKGTPHIIEHTVLQGSEKYPAREPFMQLVKGSLNTFLNAMTYPDKTMYPVSSCNDIDFKNLMDVYLDAVFHPNLYSRREIFMQEGWHYETDDKGDISINGVVYSEMKGKSSSPDSNVFDEIMTALFPDNAYGFCSGGDPEYIPLLSYEEYVDFHRKYYHPSNSYIMLYGNIDPVERLEYLDKAYLSAYDSMPPVDSIPAQKEFGRGNSRDHFVPYPVGENEDKADKTYLSFSARIGSVFDEIGSAAWDILGEVLVNDPEAYIKRALSDAGIGQEVFGGYMDYTGEPFFVVVAKNTELNNKEEFLKTINDTLVRLKAEGISKKTLNAFIERTEFKFRESAYGSYPKGLDLFRMMLKGWLYGDNDPFKYVKVLRILDELKKKVNEGYFEQLLDHLISPSHSAVIALTPEPGLSVKEEKEQKEKLEIFKNSLDESGYDKIVRDYKNLREYQEAPETEEERNCIPVLPRGSIPFEPEPISNEINTFDGVKVVSHEFETNGIVYSRILFDISDVPPDRLPYLDLLVELLGNCSTEKYPCRDLIDEVRAVTGGIDFDLTPIRDYRDPSKFTPYLTVTVRSLLDKTEASFDLVGEILTGTDLSDVQRIKEVLGETVSAKSFDLVYSGSEFSAMRALRAIDPASVFNDMTEGVGSFHVQSSLYSEFESHADELPRELTSLFNTVFDKKRAIVSLSTPNGSYDRVRRSLFDVLESIDRNNTVDSPAVYTPSGYLNEAFTCASAVQYVALCSDLGETNDVFRHLSPLIIKTLNNEILYPEIRVKGGAYGAYCSIIPGSGKIVLCSYRDPGLLSTVNVFSGVYDKLKSSLPDAEKLWQLVIGTFSKIDRPLSVYQKMCRSMNFILTGRSFFDLKKEREAILSVSEADFKNAVRYLERIKDSHSFCVIGSESSVASAGQVFRSVNKLFD